jgi:hypothetical protein
MTNKLDDWLWYTQMYIADKLATLAAKIAGADHVEFHDFADDGCSLGDDPLYWKQWTNNNDD